MKKLFLILFTAISFIASAGTPNLYFKITAEVITTDGRSVSSGVVVAFTAHPEAINSDNKMPCDLSWWVSEAFQDSGYAKISPCTDLTKWQSTSLNAAYLTVTVPVQKFSYLVFQAWAKSWLEEKYGAGNVITLN